MARKKLTEEELKKKAEAGDGQAASALALTLELGLEREPDYEEALKFYNKAAKKGDKWAAKSVVNLIETDKVESSDKRKEQVKALSSAMEKHGFKPAATKKQEVASAMSNKILIVDDNEGIRDIIRISLESFGFEFIEAEDGKIALGILEKTPSVKLVFCDINSLTWMGSPSLKLYANRILSSRFLSSLLLQPMLKKMS